MRIPLYWKKVDYSDTTPSGEKLTIQVFGWSFSSMAEAESHATQRAKKIFRRLTTDDRLGAYEYLEHPLREEIVDTVKQEDRIIGLITRNRYGALILNSPSILFVDIDFPRVRSEGFLDAILLLFSPSRRNQKKESVREATLQQVKNWAKQNPRHSFRIYRTAAGLRLLFTDGLYNPTSDETSKLLSDLKSDRLYRKLTEKQECFRARLTPKPWRCDCPSPPNSYPWDNAKAEATYRKWQQTYEEKNRGFATCQLIEALGAGSANEQIATIVSIHDHYTCAQPENKLA